MEERLYEAIRGSELRISVERRVSNGHPTTSEHDGWSNLRNIKTLEELAEHIKKHYGENSESDWDFLGEKRTAMNGVIYTFRKNNSSYSGPDDLRCFDRYEQIRVTPRIAYARDAKKLLE